jgi:hypothetical protein
MATLPSALDGLIDSLSLCLDVESARRVSEFHAAPAIQARVDVLAGRANQGLLTDDERAEYEAFVNIADLISILKVKALRQLNSQGG